MHDLGLLIGGAVIAPDNAETRKRLFPIYRLLNLIHVLLYADTTLEFNNMSFKDLNIIGLLSEKELALLVPYTAPSSTKDKARDTAIAWLGAEVTSLLEDKIIQKRSSTPIYENICGLRGVCARHHDLFTRDNPNIYVSTMVLLVDMLILISVMVVPFTIDLYVPGQDIPFQWMSMISAFIMISSLMLAQSLIFVLRDPLLTKSSSDSISSQSGLKMNDIVDARALIHSTDCAVFAQLRCTFDRTDRTTTNVPTDHNGLHNGST